VGTPRVWSLTDGRWRPADDEADAALRTHLDGRRRARPHVDRLEEALLAVVPTLTSGEGGDVATGAVALVVTDSCSRLGSWRHLESPCP